MTMIDAIHQTRSRSPGPGSRGAAAPEEESSTPSAANSPAVTATVGRAPAAELGLSKSGGSQSPATEPRSVSAVISSSLLPQFTYCAMWRASFVWSKTTYAGGES